METAEEKIIDLVDVVLEGKPVPPPVQEALAGTIALPNEKPLPPTVSEASAGPIAMPELTPEWEAKIAVLVREEVDRLIRTSVAEKLERWTREVLAREAERVITREIEALKNTPS
jgi:hypothetical protein